MWASATAAVMVVMQQVSAGKAHNSRALIMPQVPQKPDQGAGPKGNKQQHSLLARVPSDTHPKCVQDRVKEWVCVFVFSKLVNRQ